MNGVSDRLTQESGGGEGASGGNRSRLTPNTVPFMLLPGWINALCLFVYLELWQKHGPNMEN